MVDVADLSFEVDTGDLVKADKALENIEKQAKLTGSATQSLNKSFNGVGQSADNIRKASNNINDSFDKTGKASKNLGFGLQNVGFQLQDIFVQLEGGVQPTRIIAQQFPQLISGFGGVGTTAAIAASGIGALVAIGATLIPMMISSGEEAGNAADRIEEYESAMEGLRSISRDLAIEQSKLAGEFRGLRIFDAEQQLKNLQKVYQELSREGSDVGLINVLFGTKTDREEAFDQIRSISSALAQAVKEQKEIEKIEALNELKEDANGLFEELSPLTKITREYKENVLLLNKAEEEGVLSLEKKSAALAILKSRYNQQIDPFQNSLDQLREERELLMLSDEERRVEIQLRKELDEIKRSGQHISEQNIATLREEIRLNQELADSKRDQGVGPQDPVQSAFNTLQGQTTGRLQEIMYQVQALNMALQQGMITGEGYTARLNALNIEAARLRLSLGGEDFSDVALASIGKIVEGYEGALAGMSDSFGDFFSTFTQGFADSVGRAIVYSDNLGESVRDVARSALSELISSLVQVGIQYVANAAIAQAAGAAVTAGNAALAGAAAAAWAPAAALASLATLGGNSGPAIAGMTAATAVAEGLAVVGSLGFQSGGYTGNGGVSEVAGVVHGQEFVMNAAATRKNRPMLEAMNSGKKVSTGGVSVTVQNYAGVSMEVQQLSESDVVVIARRTAKEVVRQDAPQVIASDLNNPNGRTSRSLNKNTQTQRRR